jgi:hypothetical protein
MDPLINEFPVKQGIYFGIYALEYDFILRPGQDSNLRSPKEETVFETVALPLDYLGILF